MRDFWKRRTIRKEAIDLLHHARHLRHMREDVASDEALALLQTAEEEVQRQIRGDRYDLLQKASQTLADAIHGMTPASDNPVLRDWVETITLAVAIAMAFRCYFIQPFKIPTGSMQPTLNGITVQGDAKPTLMDSPGLREALRLVAGERYLEIRAKGTGVIRHVGQTPNPLSLVRVPPLRVWYWLAGTRCPGPADVYNIGGTVQGNQIVGGVFHAIHPQMKKYFEANTQVLKGQVLASGRVRSGDHIFVDKVRWSLRRPRRGDVMVFSTRGINLKGDHYIKRMAGLPGEEIRIIPPYLYVNGERVTEPYTILRIENRELGYAGYEVTNDPRHPLGSPANVMKLGPTEYLALGDNTRNSLDGRYWGGVPQENLVGPAFWVYWPFAGHWGPIH